MGQNPLSTGLLLDAHLQQWKTTRRSESIGDVVIKDERAPYFFTPNGDEFAYFETRWVAEMLLTQAARRGMRANIYRSSALDDTSGREESNFFLDLVRSMIETSLVLEVDGGGDGDSDFSIDFVTPDYIVASIFHILERIESGKSDGVQVFHIRSPDPTPLRQLPEVLGDLGKGADGLRIVPVKEWLDAVEGQMEMNGAVAREYLNIGHRMFSLSDVKTRRILDSSTVLKQMHKPPLIPRQLIGLVKQPH